MSESGRSEQATQERLRKQAIRRTFLKGGAAVAPVAFTVASRPVMAASCIAPSAFTSMNVSGRNVPQTCGGLSPGYWCAKPGVVWPSPYNRDTSNFLTTASPPGPFLPGAWGGTIGSKTMMQVLDAGTGAPYNVGRACVAALLNAAQGLTAGQFTGATVVTIWNEYAVKGYYEPVAGIKWYADTTVINGVSSAGGIIGYFQSTYN